MTISLPLMVVIPLGAGFIFPLIGKLCPKEKVIHSLAIIFAAILLLASIMIIAGPLNNTYWVGNWAPPITGIALVGDGLATFLLVIINLIAFAGIIFSTQYMRRYTSPDFYYSLFFLMVTGMNGVVITGDLFNLFVFLEIASIASYALVAFGCESGELEASFKYLVLGSIASVFVLLAIGIIYSVTGTLNMAQVANILQSKGLLASAPVRLSVAFFFIGFALKAAMVPFHAWLPDAHPSAPAPISAMLSGVLIKAIGVYCLCRIFFNVIRVDVLLSQGLMVVGAISMVVGVFLAVGQWDFKRLLAYHSISQMGYVVLAIGMAGELITKQHNYELASWALFGGLFHLFNHAAFKSLLFLCSGAVEQATGTRQLKELGGLAKKMPITSGCCRIAALSISGVPPFNGFFSKLIIVIVALMAGHYILGTLTVLVSLLTLLSFIKVQRYVLCGEVPEKLRNVKEAPIFMCTALIILAVICALAGICCPLYKDWFYLPATDVMLKGGEYVANVLGL